MNTDKKQDRKINLRPLRDKVNLFQHFKVSSLCSTLHARKAETHNSNCGQYNATYA